MILLMRVVACLAFDRYSYSSSWRSRQIAERHEPQVGYALLAVVAGLSPHTVQTTMLVESFIALPPSQARR